MSEPITTSAWAPGFRVTLGVLVWLTVLIAFESYAVNTSMPIAAQALGGVRSYGLAFTLFSAASLIGIVFAGDWNDRSGPRAPLVTSLLLFSLGLVISGAASSYAMLIAGRAISGLGAGVCMVSVYLLVARTYPAEYHPQVFGVISACWVLPSLVGPLISGLLATHVSWRAVFLLVPPLLVAAVPMLIVALRSAETSQAQGAARDSANRTQTQPTGGLIALLRGALRLQQGLPSLVAFRLIVAGVFFTAEAYIPLMLVEHRGLDPTVAGLVLTVGAMGWFLGSWSQGRPQFGLDQALLVRLGGALLGLGVALMALGVPLTVTVLWTPVAWLVAALGMGWAMTCSSVLLLRLAPAGEQGRAASAMQIGDNVGALIGSAAAGAYFAAAHRPGGDDTAVFMTIWAALGVTGASSALVARRIAARRGSG